MGEIKSLEEKLATASDALEKNKEEIECLRNASDDQKSNFSSTTSQLEAKIEKLNVERDDLSSKLVQLTKDINTRDDMLKATEEENVREKEQVRALSEKAGGFEEVLSLKETEIKSLEEKLATASDALEKNKEEIECLRNASDDQKSNFSSTTS